MDEIKLRAGSSARIWCFSPHSRHYIRNTRRPCRLPGEHHDPKTWQTWRIQMWPSPSPSHSSPTDTSGKLLEQDGERDTLRHLATGSVSVVCLMREIQVLYSDDAERSYFQILKVHNTYSYVLRGNGLILWNSKKVNMFLNFTSQLLAFT